MDTDPRDIGISDLYLPGVESHTDLQTERPQSIAEGYRTANGSARTLEGREHPVACHLDEAAPVLFDNRPGYGVMGLQEVAPFSVAEGRRFLCGTNDVGEQDGRQSPVCVDWFLESLQKLLDVVQALGHWLGVEGSVVAWEDNKACPRYLLSHPATLFEWESHISLSVHHECGNAQRADCLTDVSDLIEMNGPARLPRIQRESLTLCFPSPKSWVTSRIWKTELGYVFGSPGLMDEVNRCF